MKARAFAMIPHLIDKKVEIEMRPLVVCDECAHYDGARRTCSKNGLWCGPLWFCADGESKEEHDTDDERDCTHCQYWDGHSDECRNPESEYFESTMHGEAGCDAWGEWKP